MKSAVFPTGVLMRIIKEFHNNLIFFSDRNFFENSYRTFRLLTNMRFSCNKWLQNSSGFFSNSGQKIYWLQLCNRFYWYGWITKTGFWSKICCFFCSSWNRSGNRRNVFLFKKSWTRCSTTNFIWVRVLIFLLPDRLLIFVANLVYRFIFQINVWKWNSKSSISNSSGQSSSCFRSWSFLDWKIYCGYWRLVWPHLWSTVCEKVEFWSQQVKWCIKNKR